MAEKSKAITLKTILGQGEDALQEKKINRICAIVSMDYQAEIDRRKKRLFDLESQLESMENINSDMFDAKNYVQKRCRLLIELQVEQAEYDIVAADKSFYE